MRTIAELSQITGIDYNTVKYYTKPVEKKGAGLLAETERRNGTNYYDDDALIDLMLIGTMRKCGSSHAEIRGVLDSYELDDAFEKQEISLKRKIQELYRSLRTANLMRRFLQMIEQDDVDDDQIGMILEESFLLCLEYAEESINELLATSELTYVDVEAKEIHERIEKLNLRIKSMELRVSRGTASEDDLKAAVNDFENSVMPYYSSQESLTTEPQKSIMELWEEGAKADDASVQEFIDYMHKVFSIGIKGFTPKLFQEVIEKLIAGNEMAVLFELILGEGFTDFQLQALEVFVQSKKEGK